MIKYSSIFIIFNPKSKGDSRVKASALQQELVAKLPDMPVKCLATKYAGHARRLARDICLQEDKPLIISSSGDGGYNEVINGVADSGRLNEVVCAVLPAGNANDHSRTMQTNPLAEQIVKAKTSKIDLIKVTVTTRRHKTSWRYAHSYAGVGLTPVAAAELNKQSLNALKEGWIVAKSLVGHRPFKVWHDGQVIKIDSLIFANINKMSKILTLAEVNRPTDGKFEVITFMAGHKLRLIKELLKASVSHLSTNERQSTYHFTVIKNMPMQVDGEVIRLRAHDEVAVECVHKALLTVI